MKYHITPDGPKRCVAEVKDCQYVSDGHFESAQEATQVYVAKVEKEAKDNYSHISGALSKKGSANTVSVSSKNGNKIVERFANSQKQSAPKALQVIRSSKRESFGEKISRDAIIAKSSKHTLSNSQFNALRALKAA